MAQLVKVVDGLAISSVKVVDGLAIASVSTIDGLDNTSGGGGTIAFDAASDGGEHSSSWTWSHTTTGSNVLLWLHVLANGTISAQSYNGSAATLASTSAATGGYTVRTYYVAVGAGVGAQNVSVTLGTATDAYGIAASYTGSSQTGIPDSQAGSIDSTLADFAMTTTAVANNCRLIGAAYNSNGGTQTAGANTISRAEGGFVGFRCFDSNGARGTGSQSLNVVNGIGSITIFTVCSFKP